jgi:hypothetical protein
LYFYFNTVISIVCCMLQLVTISEYHVKQMQDNMNSSDTDTSTSVSSDNGHQFVQHLCMIYQSKVIWIYCYNRAHFNPQKYNVPDGIQFRNLWHCKARPTELKKIFTNSVSRGGYEPTTVHITLGRGAYTLQYIHWLYDEMVSDKLVISSLFKKGFFLLKEILKLTKNN